MKLDAELVAVAFKLVLNTASFRVSDSLLEPRPVLVHQEALANGIRADIQSPELRELVDSEGFEGLL
eukprot:scaffold4936_cov73-Phaeocystis_antarctica.AAC.5